MLMTLQSKLTKLVVKGEKGIELPSFYYCLPIENLLKSCLLVSVRLPWKKLRS